MTALVGAVVLGAVAHHASPLLSVIVRTSPDSTSAAEASVQAMGGRVDRTLTVLSGFSAHVPADHVGDVSRIEGVEQVTDNARIQLFSIGGYDNGSDANSLNGITQRTGATTYWQHGYTGKGVDVAVIDTGVSPVNGLAQPGKMILGPDLSFDSQAPQLRYMDGYGHGTHMAGIIAGKDSGVSGSYVGDSSNFIGMAPDARIVSIKVGDSSGAADVSQVIAAIDWVVQHRTDNGMNIRVLNLSFGTDSTQSAALDPLDYAAEQAWKAGIVVVAATGNGGSSANRLADPANDPWVLAVGAADTMGSFNEQGDSVASFSSTGDGHRNPDIVAPGVHVSSLRDPGGNLDTQHASAVVGGRLFRGSGTSEATAVVSGAAALVLSKDPSMTPDEVKDLLVTTAMNLQHVSQQAEGRGELNLAHAYGTSVGSWHQNLSSGSGTGTLEGARGSLALISSGVILSGEQDVFGLPFNSAAMATAESKGSAWSGGAWNGSAWSGSAWSGTAWSGSAWSGSGWSGSAWSGSAWSGSAWSGSAWSGSAWSGSAWSGSAWSGSGWSGSGWSGSGWSGSGWSGVTWTGAAWSCSDWG